MTFEHPDELLSRPERSLSAAEREALDEHLRDCASCAFERGVARDARDALKADAWLDRVVDGAMKRLEAQPVAAVVRLRPRAPRAAWMVAAAFALAALTALAAVALRRPQAPGPRAAAIQRVTPPTPRPTPAPTPAQEPRAELVPPPAAPEEPVRTPGASELYRRANSARHDRRDREAITLYGQLLRAWPASREALQARVSLARLLLDRREDLPRAEALFAEHLRQHPGAPDEEAAMAGRARVFELMGRRDDERRALEALLARHPESLRATTARARIDALRTP